MFLAGIIDSDGSVAKNGTCDIRIKSFTAISQLAEVLASLKFKFNKRILSDSNFDFGFGISFRPNKDLFTFSTKLQTLNIEDFENYNSNMDTTTRNNEICKIFKINKNEQLLTQGKINLFEYVYDITTASGTFYSGGMLQHNCFAFDLRNLLNYGMNFFHGNMRIREPKRSESFIALLIQSTAYISNQIMGAASYPDFFPVLDWFYRKELGHDYINKAKIGKENKNSDREFWYKIKNQFQNLIYSLNFPFRGNQSAFTNLSVMDHGFLEELFSSYYFPDGTVVNLESTLELSKLFFEYYSDINSTEGIFTFPVMTIAISLDKNGEYIDSDFVDWAAKANSAKSLANIFQSPPNSFSSCCRLKNDFSKVADVGYQNSFGVGGLSIGSHRIAGLNLPRLAFLEKENSNILEEDLEILHKILYSHRQLLKHLIKSDHLPLYTSGWTDLIKQYSTIGFIGSYEYLVNKNLDIKTDEGLNALVNVLSTIEKKIVQWQQYESIELKEKNIYNIEQIPGESMTVRLCKIDSVLNYNPNNYQLYSNQYIPLIEQSSIYDRFKIQGKIDGLTSGGAILHLNVDDEKPLSPLQFRKIMELARKTKTVYFAINYAYSECIKEHFTIGKKEKCPVCNQDIVCQYTRVVGFITPVKSWNSIRRDFEYGNRYFYKNGELYIDDETIELEWKTKQKIEELIVNN
jgi:ribonucleoside-triphosphate reductase